MLRAPNPARYLKTATAALLGTMAFAEPLQTGPTLMPTGRVCVLKNFGSVPGEPTLFTNPGFITPWGDGNLYSTSPSGGSYGDGTIFQVTPTGTATVLHTFRKYVQENGAGPTSGLVDGGDGWLYGTSYGGGHFGVGTLFRFHPARREFKILWHFRNGSTQNLLPDCPKSPYCPYTPRQRADIAGSYPLAPPVVEPGGTIYGVTGFANNQQAGVLYKTVPPYDSASYHTLCIFDQRLLADKDMAPFVCKAKGYFPNSLLQSADGTTLYGTTVGGNGSVFSGTTSGSLTTIHDFDNYHGAKPYNLLLASNGKLYGTTLGGFDKTINGTIFRLETSGAGFTVMSPLYVGTTIQGGQPAGGLVEVKPEGSLEPFLFGTTKFGGRYGRGIIFRMPLDGDASSLRVLHDFDMYITGRSSVTPLVLGPKNWLYGLTYQGGSSPTGTLTDAGVLYRLDPIVLNDADTHDAILTGGQRATDDNKVLINDPIAEVWVNVTAQQGTNVDPGGILVRARCPNPHIVQLVYRERIDAQNNRLPGELVLLPVYNNTQVRYKLTTDMNDIQWRTDVPPRELAPLAQRNAYLDQAPGAAHIGTPTTATIFDHPNFPDPPYPGGAAGNASSGETWRITARDFLVCNCQVKKEVRWSYEMKGGVAKFAHIRVTGPEFSDPAAEFDWINAHLKANGFAPIP